MIIMMFNFLFFHVHIQLKVNGARPAANVTWYNSSVAVNPENNEYSTISTKTVSD
jgi:hypothetical protein